MTWKYVSTDHNTIDAHTILDDVSSPNASVVSSAIMIKYTTTDTAIRTAFLFLLTSEYSTNCNSIPASKMGIYHPLIVVNNGTLILRIKNKLIRLAVKLQDAQIKLNPVVERWR
jgi:hypothetical protein